MVNRPQMRAEADGRTRAAKTSERAEYQRDRGNHEIEPLWQRGISLRVPSPELRTGTCVGILSRTTVYGMSQVFNDRALNISQHRRTLEGKGDSGKYVPST